MKMYRYPSQAHYPCQEIWALRNLRMDQIARATKAQDHDDPH